jgi:hypothetical protein
MSRRRLLRSRCRRACVPIRVSILCKGESRSFYELRSPASSTFAAIPGSAPSGCLPVTPASSPRPPVSARVPGRGIGARRRPTLVAAWKHRARGQRFRSGGALPPVPSHRAVFVVSPAVVALASSRRRPRPPACRELPSCPPASVMLRRPQGRREHLHSPSTEKVPLQEYPPDVHTRTLAPAVRRLYVL